MNKDVIAVWQRLAEVQADAAIRVAMAWVTLPLALAYAGGVKR